ncbi:uncharacterized protein G2W53_010240 [Senna tora]|uniref:Uncharacterized protein n=1 Tax=Senna tora TaxID=362788 RepID=A0A835CB47_9FABA|nr:uncharacterized protein G2W53_010240 [Senna tora]
MVSKLETECCVPNPSLSNPFSIASHSSQNNTRLLCLSVVDSPLRLGCRLPSVHRRLRGVSHSRTHISARDRLAVSISEVRDSGSRIRFLLFFYRQIQMRSGKELKRQSVLLVLVYLSANIIPRLIDA